MAGIGFELKKAFGERSLIKTVRGAAYSMMTVVGPLLIVMVCCFILLYVMGFDRIGYKERDLLTSIILYCFIFSLIFSSPLAASVSRFISDKVFDEQTEDILAGFFAGLLINVVLAALAGIPFSLVTVFIGGADPLVILLGYCLFMMLLVVFYDMTYIAALKEYKNVTYGFLMGMAVMLVLGYTLYVFAGVNFIVSVLAGMSSGFTVTALYLSWHIRRHFALNNHNYSAFVEYMWRFKPLFIANLFYIVGLYSHIFVFWQHPELRIVVAKTLVSAPTYDMATFLGMATSITASVIFTVRVETNFHSRYQAYCQQILGGVGGDIDIAKRNMFSVMKNEIQYLVRIQTILSIIVFLIVISVASFAGFGGAVMEIYPSVTAGYFVVYVMYCLVVFLFYFDDKVGAVISFAVFLAVTVIASVIVMHLDAKLYGLGLFTGALSALTFTFFRLMHIGRTLEYKIYCKGNLINEPTL
jgi:uncharacterized membrane protein